MSRVKMEADAAKEYLKLPARIKARMENLMARLEDWPAVSGAKPLRGRLAGRFRMRTGDYRLQFRVQGDEIVVERVGHRDRFYEG